MFRIHLAVLLAIPGLLGGICLGESLEFEVASVKVMSGAEGGAACGRQGGPGSSDPGRFHFGCVGMKALLLQAYGVRADELIGPDWISDPMSSNLYIVDAKMPPDTTKSEFQIMLQNLLKDRFHLVVHQEIRNFPGYDLQVADGGVKMKASGPPSPGSTTYIGRGSYQSNGESTSEIAQHLETMIANSMGMGEARPRVNDKTGLTGRFDVKLQYSCANGCGSSLPTALQMRQGSSPDAAIQTSSTPSDPSGNQLPNIFMAVRDQLGLKLEKARAVPVNVIVVDRVNKVPIQN